MTLDVSRLGLTVPRASFITREPPLSTANRRSRQVIALSLRVGSAHSWQVETDGMWSPRSAWRSCRLGLRRLADCVVQQSVAPVVSQHQVLAGADLLAENLSGRSQSGVVRAKLVGKQNQLAEA